MPALVAGIHVFNPRHKDVDGRNKSGHDERVEQLAPPQHRGYFEPLSNFELCNQWRCATMQSSEIKRTPADFVFGAACGFEGPVQVCGDVDGIFKSAASIAPFV